MPKPFLKLCVSLVALMLVSTQSRAQSKEYFNVMDPSLYTGSGVNPAACDGSTDDTSSFTHLIHLEVTNPTTQATIVVPPGRTCVIADVLDFSFTVGICVVGGIGAPALPYGAPPTLKFTGQARSTGNQFPPSLINFGNSSGFCMKNLMLEYTNNNIGGSFLEGFAIQVNNIQPATTAPVFQNLMITSSSNSVNSATCLISLDFTINAVIDNVMFDRAQNAICGVRQTVAQNPADFSNAITVRNSFFNPDGAITNAMILNNGSAWTIGPNNFFTFVNTNVPVLQLQNGFACDSTTFEGNLIGNPAPSSNTNFISVANSGCSLAVRGNYFQGNSGSTAINFTGTGSLVADGNTFTTLSPFNLNLGLTAEIGLNEYVNTSPTFPTTPIGGARLFTYPQLTTLDGAVNTNGNLTVNGNTAVFGNMSVSGTITKSAGSFKIDHPLDPAHKYLSHSFVESPDMENLYDGIVTLDKNGQAEVRLPDYFEALNRDFRYHLSCIGGFAPVFVSQEIKDNTFHISGGKAGLRVSWMVSGIRQDSYANTHRIQVEENKAPFSAEGSSVAASQVRR